MSARKPPTVRLRRLAKELVRLRLAAGFATHTEAAAALHMDPTTMWRLERALTVPLKRTVLVCLELYGVKDPAEQARYLELRTRSAELNWLAPYEGTLPEDYQGYINFEVDAARLNAFDAAFVPGLLQTPEYARAVIRGVHRTMPEDEVAQRAEVRARRQEVLARKRTPLWMVIDEAILHRPVGGPEVMRAQLDALLDGDARRVQLQVVPFGVGAHPGSQGSFVVMQFAEDPDLVYIETLTGSVILESAEEVSLHSSNFEHLIALALSQADSRKLISARRKDFAT
ncbi:DUF5753 domain-containing protein [Catenuloplanes sp. NPDC051500]|uniref:DUF5753 domain-containing protein n=1 Tax=Catenuloplanes sp. NPDC051500 TaxID=3363959 RepID=UPI00378DBE01